MFVAAVTLRSSERHHRYHEVLHEAADTTERVGSALLLILIGGAVAEGGLGGIGPAEIAVALAIVVLVRPIVGWVSLVGLRLDRRARGTIAVYGIRGMRSVYYLAHAANEETFEGIAQLWSVVLLVILLSVVLHGVTAAHAVRRATGAAEPIG